MSKTGYSEFSAQLGRICSDMGKAEGVRQATQLVRTAAVLKAPGRTGYLRDNIFSDLDTDGNTAVGTVYTNVSYSPYVELGTGPKGAAEHEGISPEITPAYTMEPWWIHESQIDAGTAEEYHWPCIDTPEGKFYKCTGQPARPFMYPALKDNENEVVEIISGDLDDILKKVTK